MIETGNQLKAARALLGISQEDLSERCGYGITTVRRLEQFGAQPLEARISTVKQIQSTLEEMGVVFINADQDGGHGVRLKNYDD